MVWLGPPDYEYGRIQLNRPHLWPLRYEQPIIPLVRFMRLVSPGWQEGEDWLVSQVERSRDRGRDLVDWDSYKEDERGREYRFMTRQSTQQLTLSVYRK